MPCINKEKDELCCDNQEEESQLRSFACCLKPCVLTGLKLITTKEKYHPHRVARQFGYDQDIPSDISDPPEYEIAWQKFSRRFSIRNPKSFVRSRFLEASVTCRYQEWWNTFSFPPDQAASKVMLEQQKISKNGKRTLMQESVDAEKKRKTNTAAQVECSIDDDTLPLSQSLKRPAALVEDRDSDNMGKGFHTEDIDEDDESLFFLNDVDTPVPICFYTSDSTDKKQSRKKNRKKSDSGKASAKRAGANTKIKGKCANDKFKDSEAERNTEPADFEARIGKLEKLISSLKKS